jgi:hypothetical protein
MRAFICVYRHPIPSKRSRKKVEEQATKDPLLKKFLGEYDNANCFYDWGDDPSFFAAQEILGNSRFATWGVCRRPVRGKLSNGDLVIYFCGKPRPEETKIWDYYFIGFGTVKETILHEQLWLDTKYSVYQRFYNLLEKPAGDKWEHYEPFGTEHDDWKRRSSAPYIIFDEDEQLTDFNVINPLHVATKPKDLAVEKWNSSRLVKRLEDILFEQFDIERRLRTKNKYIAHQQIVVHRYIPKDERMNRLISLRTELKKISLLVRN